MYQTETYHGWYGESRPRQDPPGQLLPLSVYRQAARPTFQATRLSDDSEENIRFPTCWESRWSERAGSYELQVSQGVPTREGREDEGRTRVSLPFR